MFEQAKRVFLNPFFQLHRMECNACVVQQNVDVVQQIPDVVICFIRMGV